MKERERDLFVVSRDLGDCRESCGDFAEFFHESLIVFQILGLAVSILESLEVVSESRLSDHLEGCSVDQPRRRMKESRNHDCCDQWPAT